MSAFGGSGRIRLALFPQSVDEAICLLDRLQSLGEKNIVVGACTNTLFPDGVWDTTVVCLSEVKGIALEDGGIYAYAGEKLCAVCVFAKNNCLSGLQNLYTIPGSVGGGIAMNCGCFGSSISDCVQYVDCCINGKIARIDKADLDFGYRSSNIFIKKAVVLGVKFALTVGDFCAIDGAMKATKARRLSLQPQEKSLGSVFKKVGEQSAGYYIERVGLKGFASGGAKISDKHANFIVNNGNATSADFVYLATLARQQVDKSYDIKLEYEVKILE